MASASLRAEAPRAALRGGGRLLGGGLAAAYLGFVVLVPLAFVALEAASGGFWEHVSGPQARAALEFTLVCSLAVTAINVVMGTLVAWVLVRDEFPGKRVLNALIDLPFALPTIVAGLTLLALYGPSGPAPVDVSYARAGVILALLFVTLPFVVRAVQPVLIALDREMEEAAASLGASPGTVFRRIVAPNLAPAIVAGAGLSFARAVGEFGSVVLISGNLPFRTEVASVFVYGQIETGNVAGAAAVSVLLLGISLVLLTAFGALGARWTRHA